MPHDSFETAPLAEPTDITPAQVRWRSGFHKARVVHFMAGSEPKKRQAARHSTRWRSRGLPALSLASTTHIPQLLMRQPWSPAWMPSSRSTWNLNLVTRRSGRAGGCSASTFAALSLRMGCHRLSRYTCTLWRRRARPRPTLAYFLRPATPRVGLHHGHPERRGRVLRQHSESKRGCS